MNRCLEPEWLDELPAEDPQATGSRRDLRRLNWWMGHVGILARSLRLLKQEPDPIQIIEVGAGDGDFLLRVAHALGRTWSGTRAVLMDRQKVVSPTILASFRNLGWHAEVATADVFDWCSEPASGKSMVVANLFLHHFDSEQLKKLFDGIARRSSAFIALEPRRSALPLLFSNLVWLIGCNSVTRHDAPTSVRAGFRDRELSELWPNDNHWLVRECAAGAFSHLFTAQAANRAR